MALAYGASAVTLFVPHVCEVAIPPEIAQDVVGVVAIVVATFHSRRAGPDKSFKNQPANCTTAVLAIA
jgi:hypothetical protein